MCHFGTVKIEQHGELTLAYSANINLDLIFVYGNLIAFPKRAIWSAHANLTIESNADDVAASRKQILFCIKFIYIIQFG